MAHLLVTQVSEEDEKKRAAALAAPQAKPAAAAETKKKSCWWQVFCCGCCATEEEEPPKAEQKKPPGGGQQESKAAEAPAASAAPAAPASADPDAQPEAADGEGSSEEPRWLLEPMTEEDKKMGKKKTLVLDLDETLVHSSFTYIPDADFIIDIELDGAVYKVYVRKRPFVDEFMRAVGKKFEVVIFTASLAKYADPLLDILDQDRVVSARLFRESCVEHYGNYVKDLSLLGRRLEDSIIIDNSPFSYMFQPDNAVPITSWFNDKNDRELLELLPFLDSLLDVEDVCTVLSQRNA